MKIKLLLFVSLASLAVLPLRASLINFQSGAGVTALQSDGVSTLTEAGSGAFTFALGTFDESALSNSSSTWQSSFSDQMVDTNDWQTSGPVADRFLGEVIMSDGAATSSPAYIFGYNVSDASQVIVFKNDSWVFPVYDQLDLQADIFSLQDANTQVVQSNGTFTAFSNSFTMIAVPEPSTYAALAGLMALSWVAVRRRRS